MKIEKIIKPANGYLMLFILIALFFGSIATAIRAEDPRFLIVTFIGFFGLFGFILVNPNTSKVILLFGKYIGTIKDTVFIGQTLYSEKNHFIKSE